MDRSQTRAKRARAESEHDKGHARPALSELITLQLQTELGELKQLDNLLLAIYLVRAGTLLDRAYDRYCQSEHGISGGDMGVLFALRRSGPPFVSRPTDLFRVLLVTSGAITKKVDRLTAAGCVERLPDPGHKGGFLVRLTKLGLRMVDQAAKYLAANSVLAPAIAQMKPEERRAGSDFVLKILAALEKAESD
jgi:DNA-binding MarR family transcriptional regulator